MSEIAKPLPRVLSKTSVIFRAGLFSSIEGKIESYTTFGKDEEEDLKLYICFKMYKEEIKKLGIKDDTNMTAIYEWYKDEREKAEMIDESKALVSNGKSTHSSKSSKKQKDSDEAKALVPYGKSTHSSKSSKKHKDSDKSKTLVPYGTSTRSSKSSKKHSSSDQKKNDTCKPSGGSRREAKIRSLNDTKAKRQKSMGSGRVFVPEPIEKQQQLELRSNASGARAEYQKEQPMATIPDKIQPENVLEYFTIGKGTRENLIYGFLDMFMAAGEDLKNAANGNDEVAEKKILISLNNWFSEALPQLCGPLEIESTSYEQLNRAKQVISDVIQVYHNCQSIGIDSDMFDFQILSSEKEKADFVKNFMENWSKSSLHGTNDLKLLKDINDWLSKNTNDNVFPRLHFRRAPAIQLDYIRNFLAEFLYLYDIDVLSHVYVHDESSENSADESDDESDDGSYDQFDGQTVVGEENDEHNQPKEDYGRDGCPTGCHDCHKDMKNGFNEMHKPALQKAQPYHRPLTATVSWMPKIPPTTSRV
ncbi:hypothetical protein HYFRA_00001205 [Hymenoscyphus fraxineus]|uniref:Uncharacterized protein n=1 Tax=Hymenoscyphus fraxineus TaxID=746836 RepID=A0A9N9KT33_9HELO|nr:hypothetical protein HYFRA_00001205 [Hymenoscyphus fraxineus]